MTGPPNSEGRGHGRGGASRHRANQQPTKAEVFHSLQLSKPPPKRLQLLQHRELLQQPHSKLPSSGIDLFIKGLISQDI